MADNLHKGADPHQFYYSRENRRTQTPAEKILWSHLRNRQLCGFKFRRQHPMADFIADFYCHERGLIVEVDGGYHSTVEQRQYDRGRTFELAELKVRVIRFSNEEVINDLESVLKTISVELFKPLE